MSFYPIAGNWSVNNFSDSSGTFTDSSRQFITGGYVSLIPSLQSEWTFVSSWSPFTGWNLINGMETKRTVTGSFTLLTGVCYDSGYYSGQEAYQSSVISAGAWEIYSDYSTNQLVNVPFQSLLLGSGSVYSGWYNHFNAGNSTASFEFDVASFVDIYSGINILAGYQTGSNQLTGLPSITGCVGHGVYISNGTYADYLEILPYGIRSVSHPELAISVDLTSPKRFRIGLNNQDLYIVCETTKSVVGFYKFDTATNTDPCIVIGAPPITGRLSLYSEFGISDVVGHTYWGSFKVVTGSLVGIETSGVYNQTYTTSPVSMYTDVFDPKIPINYYSNAIIGFVPYFGGDTIITPQYSGTTGFVDLSSHTITSSTSNPLVIDISNIPIRSYPLVDLTNSYISNPIRFKITQSSNNGISPSPAIDYIEINASKESDLLDINPNWKPINKSAEITLSVLTGHHYFDEPKSDIWTTTLLNIPGTVGEISGIAFTDQSIEAHNVTVNGTGLIELGGRYGYCFTNYEYKTAMAVSGSDAERFFGRTRVYNVFTNPELLTYRPVLADNNYVTGYTFGEICEGLNIPTLYTGLIPVTYEAVEVYRPVINAQQNRLYSILGLATNPNQGYIQSITTTSLSTGLHNGTVGIEITIPSGIVTQNMLANIELNIPAGDELLIYTTGSAPYKSWIVNGDDFRIYRPISVPVYNTTTGELKIGFVIPSGKDATEVYNFNLDNISVVPISTSYLELTGLEAFTHLSGIINDRAVVGTVPPLRAGSVFNTDLYLENYPLETGILFQITGHNAKGINVTISSDGILKAECDFAHRACASSVLANPFYQSLGKQTIQTNQKIPIGRWINLGVTHQCQTYDKLSTVNYSGALAPTLYASSNRLYITLDGYPISTLDCESGWYRRNVIDAVTNDSTPLVTYIDISGSARAVIMSGLFGSIDGLRFDRPPYADVEVYNSIDGAKITFPYFVPDVFHKPTVSSSISNSLVRPDFYNTFGLDSHLGSIYNFSNPGYTHWDHGPWRNHLIFSGTILKESTSPYSGLGSTRFTSGSIGTAYYSSATERLCNSAANLDLLTLYTTTIQNYGRFTAQGWIYPRTTGTIFSIIESVSNPTGARLDFTLNDNQYLQINRHTNSGTIAFSVTGNEVKSLNEWNYVGFDYLPGTGKYIQDTTGFISVGIFNSGEYEYLSQLSGINYSLRYGGHTGDSISSYFRFAGNIDANYCDWSISCPKNDTYYGAWDTGLVSFATGNKGGRYQTLIHNSNPYTGTVQWNSFNSGVFTLGTTSDPAESAFFVASMNAYDNNARMNGGVILHDNQTFEEINSYQLSYDNSIVDQAIGGLTSPINIGPIVPPNAINIARINSVEHTTEDSISTINLSHYNRNNLLDYRGGTYSIYRNSGTIQGAYIVTGYKNINSGLYTGLLDITYLNSVSSNNIEVSNIPISDIDLTVPSEAYYYYLIGRGYNGVYIPDYIPHSYSGISQNYTGAILNNLLKNKEAISNSILVKYTDGTLVPFDEYPYDIVISPYNINHLENAVISGYDISLNLESTPSGEMLADGVFSVLMLLNKKHLNDTVWVTYTSYNYLTNKITTNYKEVINSQPINRPVQDYENPTVGLYSISKNINSNNFDITLHGIKGEFSGSL